MKTRIIFTAFAIMVFAAMANAQSHVRAFNGTDFSSLVPMARQSTSSTDIPVLNLIAGQPIRVQVAAEKGQDDIIVGATTAVGHVKTTAIPCRNVPSTSARRGGGDQQEYMTIKFADLLISSTQPSWKNTCRMLTVKLQNGREFRGKIRFS